MDVEQWVEKWALRYVTDSEPGFRRSRWGRGFTYYHPDGRRVREQSLKERFSLLVIPPAWEDVWICQFNNGHLQSTGRDDAARKQYLYHPLWAKVRDQRKFSRMLGFGSALPELRQQISRDLNKAVHSRERVVATAVRLLDSAFLRIGNEAYTNQHGTYGLTTLEPEHVTIQGPKISLEFEGKSHIEQDITLKDSRIAWRIKQMQELPGERLFQYEDEEGGIHPIDSTDVNHYLQTYMGESYSAKDFRTWAGSVLTMQNLVNETDSAVEAVKMTAKVLGNTATVCRNYYVHPLIFQAHENGELNRYMVGRPKGGLNVEESALLRLLKEGDD